MTEFINLREKLIFFIFSSFDYHFMLVFEDIY